MAKTHGRQHLRTKIIAWSFIPTAIILSAVAWLTFYSYQKVIGDMLIIQDQGVVASKAEQLSLAMGNLVNSPLISIMMEVDFNPGDPIEIRAQKILRETKNLDVFDGGIFFVNEKGEVVVAGPERADLLGKDWSKLPYFQYEKEHPGNAFFTSIQPIGPQGEDVICVVMSMAKLETKFAGAGYYCLLIQPNSDSAFYTTMTGLNLDPHFYLLDGNLRVIFAANSSLIGMDLSTEQHIRQLLDSQKMAARVKKGSEDVLASYSPVFGVSQDYRLGWILMKEQEWADIMRPTLAYRQLLMLLLALGLIVPVIVTLIGVKHITDPIQKLIQAAEQVTAGRFDQRIDVRTDDEIETLAEQFNMMSARLQESYSSLENKVAERTRELAIMNSIISVSSRSLNIQEILEDALGKTVEHMNFNSGAAFVLDAGTSTMSLVSNRGLEHTTAAELAQLYQDTNVGITPEARKQVVVLQADSTAVGQLQKLSDTSQLRAVVFVPLASKGRALGLFILGQRSPRQFSHDELSLLSSIGQQVGVAMENAHLYEQAEHVAIVAERHRLARELHDAVTQTLFSANLIADVLPRIWERNPEEGLQSLEELRQLTRGALAEMRTMLLEMRPEFLERSDLKSLLAQLVDAFVGRVRVPANLTFEGQCNLSQDTKVVFYRVAQETLNNIAKHSGARHVDIHLECGPGKVTLVIQDDGLGFDTASIPAGHMGISLMRERAVSIGASLNIQSQTGQGTKVELEFLRRNPADEYL